MHPCIQVDGSQGLGGQRGFCLGEEEEGWDSNGEFSQNSPRSPPPPRKSDSSFKNSPRPTTTSKSGKALVATTTPEQEKRFAFMRAHDWAQLHALMVDAAWCNHV